MQMHLSVIKGKYAADVLSVSRCAHLCVMSQGYSSCESMQDGKKERKKKERGHFGGLCVLGFLPGYRRRRVQIKDLYQHLYI